MEKLTKWLAWPITLLGVMIISSICAVLSANYFTGNEPLAIGFALFFFISIIILSRFWQEVPQDEIWLTSVYGVGYRELQPGGTLLLPFGLEKIDSQTYIGQQRMKIYLDKEVKPAGKILAENVEGNEVRLAEEGAFIFGNVNFKDCSNLGADINFFFKIINVYKATYDVENLYFSMAEKVASLLNDNFLEYQFDDIKKSKKSLNKMNLACARIFTDPAYVAPTQAEYQNSELYKMMADYGVEIIDIDIVDFRITAEVAEEIQRKQAAENDRKVKELEFKTVQVENKIKISRATGSKKEKIILAEGDKEASELRGKGEAAKIKAVSDAANLSADQKARFLVEKEKWGAIAESKSTDKVILVEGNSQVANGVGFGAGAHTTNPAQPRNP